MRSLKKFISLLSFSAIAVCGLAFSLNKKANSQSAEASISFSTYTNHDGDTYYNGISDTLQGDALLSELRSLNSSKRRSTVGYSGMGTTPSGQFKYTDYDPSSVQYDENGQPYGTRLTTFYSGNSAQDGMNREHVWPNSHGGNVVENDIHMPRPTLQKENGSRGNSFYVEGKCHSSSGWDPAMESFGDETYRGDSARIIFYCVVANDRLDLLEADSHSTSNSNKDYLMGKLSDLIKWNLEYPVLQREQNRNEGAEYLQGNRNPFIDHPEYACKIWGTKNDKVRELCKSQPVTTKNLVSLAVTGTPTKTVYNEGENFDPNGLKVTASFDDGSSSDVTSAVKWTKPTLGSNNVTGSYTYNNVEKTVTVSGLTVKEVIQVKTLTNLLKEGQPLKTEYLVGDDFDPSGLKITAVFSDASTEVVTNQMVWDKPELGKTSVKGYYTYSGKTLYVTINGLSVTEPIVEKNLVSLSVTGTPEKTKYYLGDSFKPNGLTVTALYDDDTEQNVTNAVSWSELTLSSTSVTGSYTYKDVTKTVTVDGIKVTEPYLVDIAISKYPKLVYTVGEEFDITGIEVEAHYSDGGKSVITDEVAISTPDLSSAGEKQVFVSYLGLMVSYTAMVLENTVTSIQLMKTPAKFEYFANEKLNTYGMVIRANMSNGNNIENVTDLCKYTYNFYNNGTIQVSFGGAYFSFAVIILEGEPTVEHEAADFAYAFNEKFEELEVEEVSKQQWDSLEYNYNLLDDEAKQYVKTLNNDSGEGSVSADVPNADALRKCVAKYDETYLAHKDEGFNDFIGRNPTAPSHNDDDNKKDDDKWILILAIAGGIVLLTILIIIISVSASKKGKKKYA